MKGSLSFDASVRSAVQAHGSGEFHEVVSALQDFVADCLKDRKAAFLLIHALWRVNQSFMAEKLATEVLSTRPEDIEIVKICALIYKQIGQTNALLQSLKHIIVFAPHDVGSHIKLLTDGKESRLRHRLASWIFCMDGANSDVIRLLVQNGEVWSGADRTLAMARRSVLLEPANSQSLRGFLRLFGTEQTNDGFTPTWLDWLLVVDQRNDDIYLFLATRFARVNRSSLAIDILWRAHKRIPSSNAIKTELIAALTIAGRYELVSKFVELPLENDAEMVGAEALATSMIAAGHVDSAITFLESKLATIDDFTLRRLLVWIYSDDYRFKKAARHAAILTRTSPDEIQRTTHEAFLEIGHDNFDLADTLFERIARLNEEMVSEKYRASQSDMMRVSRRFHELLNSVNFGDLVPMHYIGDPSYNRSRIFVTVDQEYLDQFLYLILSNAPKAGDFKVHLHIVCPRDSSSLKSLSAYERLIVTVEDPDLGGWSEAERKAYFSCIRFVRAWSMLASGEVDRIALVDVDTEWLDPMASIMDQVGNQAMALFHDPAAPPWAKFNATCGVYTSTPDTIDYLHHVARYIWWFLINRRSRWRLGQCALYCALLHFRRDNKSALKFQNLSEHMSSILRDTRGNTDRSTAVERARFQSILIQPVADALESMGGNRDHIVKLLSIGLAATPSDKKLRERVGRLMLQTGDLRGLLNILPAEGDCFWNDPSRDDLKINKKSLEQFLKLNTQYLSDVGSAPGNLTTPSLRSASSNEVICNIANAYLEKNPFNYFLIDEFLPPPQYERLANQVSRFPIVWGDIEPYMDRGAIARSSLIEDAGWTKLIETLESQEFLDCIVWRLGAEKLADQVRRDGFDLRPSFRITVDQRNYSLGPHKDHPARFASALFYFPLRETVDGLGTCIYRRKNPEWVLDNGLHGEFEDFELVRQIAYRPNKGFVFLNLGNAYHGVERVDVEEKRFVLQYTISMHC